MKASKKGFSLVELIIVIGIIGVLSAVMLGVLSGSSDSARATKCMTNMRAITVATMNVVTDNDWRHFPAAGSYKWIDYKNGKKYYTVKGWISWGNDGGENKSGAGNTIYFDEADQKQMLYAITNGAIWAAGAKSQSTYRCPAHELAFKKANGGRLPGWSYVMNEAMGWNDRNPATIRAMSSNSMCPKDAVSGSNAERPIDKVLLFAEMQGYDDKKRGLTAVTKSGGNKGDSVLQYIKEKETIGFNHPQSGGKLYGHVAFADGHVEKFQFSDASNARQLTEWLCSGREVSFSGKHYNDIQGN